MDSDKTSAALESEVKQLATALKGEIVARQKASKAATSVTMVLSCIILFFVVLNFFYFRSQWTGDAFAKSLEREVHELQPLALKELRELGEDVLPVYLDEGRRQIGEKMPEISALATREIDKLGTDLRRRVHTRVSRSLDRFSTKTRSHVMSKFPEFRDPKSQVELERRLRTVTEAAVLAPLVEFDKRFKGDVDDLTKLVLNFDVSDSTSDPVELQKRFLRLWLRLLDLEVMEI